ncbi:unannotated protein [freshwater metagenome]|uniref:Unannotated protein n=1 Tax=freshwater metagenome TaxID=449393 RepID=A0A6J6BY95_9ZZZZ|nr:hypothetical protein [Actinomycetota bacterium]MSY78142.1 hypothetical protein [Actinomycetota bacterium]MTA63845.1 hypothetical protein [Actinomycetota bacterium]
MKARLMMKSVAGLLLVMGTAVAIAAPASASTTTVTPNPVTVTPNQTTANVTVNWTGLAANTLVFVDVCKKSITDASFDVASDCGAYSGITPNGNGSGTNSAVLEVFRGQDPAGESWGCFAAGDTAPAGVTKYTTCYVRVTDNSVLNNDSDSEQAFTFSVSSGDVPEAPLTILLPVVGTLAALGGFVLIRRRQTVSV